MSNPLLYLNEAKDQHHIFIFSVAGRSSSTAFQRIINSSNSAWIWGEQHGIIEAAISLISLMKKFQETADVKNSLFAMYDSFRNDRHLSFYPNAIGNIDQTIELINNSICNLLKPWDLRWKRFGFKDIGVNDIYTLDYLKELFINGAFIFCFRNPIKQWPSVQASGWWPYSVDIESFLTEYYRISSIYLEFSDKTGIKTFIENTDLRNMEKLKIIIAELDISGIDFSLTDSTVSSAKSNKLSEQDQNLILNSDAYRNYLEMKRISDIFYANTEDKINHTK